MTDAALMDITATPESETMLPEGAAAPNAREEVFPAPPEREETSPCRSEDGGQSASPLDDGDHILELGEDTRDTQRDAEQTDTGELSPDTVTYGASEAAMGDVRDGASALTSAALVETRVEAVAPRRNKRRHPEMALSNDAAPLLAAGIADRDGDTADTPEAQPHGAPAAAPLAADDLDDPAWREHWPQNEVRIVGRLLPRASDAPVLDGVRRTRMEVVS